MITYCVMKMITTSSTSDRAVFWLQHQPINSGWNDPSNLSLGMCWKLLWSTLKWSPVTTSYGFLSFILQHLNKVIGDLDISFQTLNRPCHETFKGAQSRFAHIEKLSLNFSNSLFAIRANLLYDLSHPCSFKVYYYPFDVFLSWWTTVFRFPSI